MGAGTSSLFYSLEHRNEHDFGKFFKGFAQTAVVGALVGAATAGVCSWMAGASTTTTIAGSRVLVAATRMGISQRAVNITARLVTAGIRAGVNTAGSVANEVDKNAVDDEFYGAHKSLLDGISAGSIAKDFAMNAGLEVGGKWWEEVGSVKYYQPLRDRLLGAEPRWQGHTGEYMEVFGSAEGVARGPIGPERFAIAGQGQNLFSATDVLGGFSVGGWNTLNF
jgi:hypothetical protein